MQTAFQSLPFFTRTMQTNTPQEPEFIFNSYLSFRPLVEALKKNIEHGNPGLKKLYGEVVLQF